MQVDLLAILGDAMWILVLATIASSSRRLSQALPPGVRLPMQWSLTRKPAWRAPQRLAFTLMVGVPLLVGLTLSTIARDPRIGPQGDLIVFLVRAVVAPLHMLIHWGWMRAVARTLEAEGALKP